MVKLKVSTSVLCVVMLGASQLPTAAQMQRWADVPSSCDNGKREPAGSITADRPGSVTLSESVLIEQPRSLDSHIDTLLLTSLHRNLSVRAAATHQVHAVFRSKEDIPTGFNADLIVEVTFCSLVQHRVLFGILPGRTTATYLLMLRNGQGYPLLVTQLTVGVWGQDRGSLLRKVSDSTMKIVMQSLQQANVGRPA